MHKSAHLKRQAWPAMDVAETWQKLRADGKCQGKLIDSIDYDIKV